jgi:hypothetical protein
MNPAASTAEIHSHRGLLVRLSANVNPASRSTPAATVRAAFSLTGFGKPNQRRDASPRLITLPVIGVPLLSTGRVHFSIPYAHDLPMNIVY